MLRPMKRLIPLLALIALLPLRSSAETTIGTAIPSVPYAITKAGVYRFTKNLVFAGISGDAIRIAATDVVIDLNGYELLCDSGTSNFAAGIECSAESRVTIKDGTVRGFQNGLILGSDYVRLTDLLVTGCLESGITVVGNHSQILHNRVSQIGISGTYAIGITLTGTDGTISENDLQAITQTDTNGHYADGIRIKGCSKIIVTNNRVMDVEPSAPTKGASTGIATVSPSDNLILIGNTVLTAETGFDLTGGASGEFGDNITGSVTTPYLTTSGTMTNIGNNN